MKKFLFALLAMASFSSASVGWGSAVHIKQIWIAPGPTPVVRITTDAATYPTFGFYLNPTGNAEILKIARAAMVANLPVMIYGERGSYANYSTGLYAPNISSITNLSPLYNMTIDR